VLYVDGQPVAAADRIEQVSLLDSGTPIFWIRQGDRERVVVGTRESPGFRRIYMPDIEALSALARPTAGEWGYRGGERTAFAGRNSRGDWTSVVRYPAAPRVEDRRPLSTSRAWNSAPDPTTLRERALRYRLLKARVPVYIGVRKNEECLVVGTTINACGRRIALLAHHAASGRLAYGLETRRGLLIHSGYQVFGPASNADWVTFSRDGRHLAMVLRQGREHVLIVDDEPAARGALIESVAWTADHRVVHLIHEPRRSRLYAGATMLLEKDLISGVYLSPLGDLLVPGRQGGEFFLDPYGPLPDVAALWSEGFLAGGEFFAAARLEGGGQAVLFQGEMSPPHNALVKLSVSHTGRRLAAVAADVDRDLVMVPLDPGPAIDGRAEEVGWCPRDRLFVKERTGSVDCLVGEGGGRHCCDRLVLWSCPDDGPPLLVCLEESRFVLRRGENLVGEPFDAVPLHLAYRDGATGTLALAGRRQADWFLLLDGREQHANGVPTFVYPAAAGPWYQVASEGRKRWVSPGGKGAWYDIVSPPFQLEGHTAHRARRDGREAWVVEGEEGRWTQGLISAPVPYGKGFFFWALEGDERVLYRLSPAGPATSEGE